MKISLLFLLFVRGCSLENLLELKIVKHEYLMCLH